MRPVGLSVGLGDTVSGAVPADGDRDRDGLSDGEPAEELTGGEDSEDGEGDEDSEEEGEEEDGEGEGEGEGEVEVEEETEGEGEGVGGAVFGLGVGVGVGVAGGCVGRSPCPESPRGRAIHPWSWWSYSTKTFTIVIDGATTTTFAGRYPGQAPPVKRGVPDWACGRVRGLPQAQRTRGTP